jgi:hypothetical protein
MSSTVLRAAAESTPQPESAQQAPADKGVPRGTSEVEPPFTDYQSQKGKPFVVDYYGMEGAWSRFDSKADQFLPEVQTMNTYMEHLIEKGDINNTTESVKNELKRIEKLVNIQPDSRSSMRMEIVAEYMKFLLKSEGIRVRSAKYGLV